MDAGLRTLVCLAAVLLSTAALAFDHAHKAWDGLLRKHVGLIDGGKASRLDYAAIAQERAALRGYLDGLSRVSEAEFQAWSRPERMAFLINAYNAYTVEKVLTRYPSLKSIWDFGRFFANPFRDPFFSLLGGRMSLDTLEHEILRKKYSDPRIHYAVNCASVGCPMLREEAYAAAQLDHQLEEQARRFLSDRSRNRLRDGRLEVSKIFDWFREDFEPLERYLAQHAALLAGDPAEQQLIRERKASLRFLDYDWSLNDSRSSSPR
ncbi:MAG TPA: DUF547 domain-containing protein [Burkholderiales bacterium]|nr:DUF547 domain-containing protein [Burkholderiales bacterium]